MTICSTIFEFIVYFSSHPTLYWVESGTLERDCHAICTTDLVWLYWRQNTQLLITQTSIQLLLAPGFTDNFLISISSYCEELCHFSNSSPWNNPFQNCYDRSLMNGTYLVYDYPTILVHWSDSSTWPISKPPDT